MAAKGLRRRQLAAIVAADVVGYSRLMGDDEEGTLSRLKDHHKEVIDPETSKYGGRIFKTMGDGFLIEFSSVVDAVKCAVDIQRAMGERNAGMNPEIGSSFASASIWATSFWRTAMSSGMVSTSRLAWKGWLHPVAFACRGQSATTFATGCPWRFTISDYKPSRISRVLSASLRLNFWSKSC